MIKQFRIYLTAALVSICLAVATGAQTRVHSGATASGARTTTTARTAQRQNVRVLVANDFPGRDLGAKINAAVRSLGNARGEIEVRGGGTISTQVVIGPGHTLRFSPGTFYLRTELMNEGVFLLKSGTTVVGSGWNTVIVEPPSVGWRVFQAYDDARSQPAHSGMNTDIKISNLQIKGANPHVEGGVRQTVGLGNCHRCTVEGLWLNGTGVIGVQAGGSPLLGYFADNVTIRNNQFTGVASQAAAVVNGRNVVIDGNTFRNSGRAGANQGMTAIDIEPNDHRDIIQNITITNNVVDSRGSGFLHGNGIVVQNGAATRNFGPVRVSRNTIVGGELSPQENGKIAVGIYITGNTQNVEVTDNIVRRVAHSGIRLENATRNHVARNKLISTGSGGTLAFELLNTTDSEIVDNVVSVDPNSQAATSVIQETGSVSRNNVYRGNTNGQRPLAPITLGRGRGRQ